MSKPVKLTTLRFGMPYEWGHNSVEDAAFNACCDVESNEASPCKIFENGKLIWENTGPFDGSYAKLRELANWEDDK